MKRTLLSDTTMGGLSAWPVYKTIPAQKTTQTTVKPVLRNINVASNPSVVIPSQVENKYCYEMILYMVTIS